MPKTKFWTFQSVSSLHLNFITLIEFFRFNCEIRRNNASSWFILLKIKFYKFIAESNEIEQFFIFFSKIPNWVLIFK